MMYILSKTEIAEAGVGQADSKRAELIERRKHPLSGEWAVDSGSPLFLHC